MSPALILIIKSKQRLKKEIIFLLFNERNKTGATFNGKFYWNPTKKTEFMLDPEEEMGK